MEKHTIPLDDYEVSENEKVMMGGCNCVGGSNGEENTQDIGEEIETLGTTIEDEDKDLLEIENVENAKGGKKRRKTYRRNNKSNSNKKRKTHRKRNTHKKRKNMKRKTQKK